MTVQRDVVVTVLKQNAPLSRPGFGVMAIVGYHTAFVNRMREFGSLAELVTAGFATTHPVYKAANAALAQNPRVRRFKVGRLTAATRIVQIGVGTAVNSATYTVTINGTAYAYTADSATTVQEIVEGLTALINADTPLPVTASEDNVTLTLTADVAGAVFTLAVSDNTGLNVLTVKDVTADRGMQTQLNAILAEDDQWYGLAPADSFGATEIAQIAAWTEANKKLCAAVTADTGCIDSVITNDIMSTLKASSYERTMVVYHPQTETYPNACIMSRQFSQPPGTSNPAHKNLVGPPSVKMTSAQMTSVETKNGNHYTDAGGAGRYRYGRMPSGEWFDIVHGTDWIESEAEFDLYGAFASNENVPFTQPGAHMLGKILESVLGRGVRAGFLAADPAPFATIPDVLDPTLVTAQNRQDRVLPGVEAQARYAGAVNRITLTLRLGV